MLLKAALGMSIACGEGMKKNNQITIIEQEMKRWFDVGLIDRATYGRLQEHYQASDEAISSDSPREDPDEAEIYFHI
jgi:hypothetical protein